MSATPKLHTSRFHPTRGLTPPEPPDRVVVADNHPRIRPTRVGPARRPQAGTPVRERLDPQTDVSCSRAGELDDPNVAGPGPGGAAYQTCVPLPPLRKTHEGAVCP